MSVHVLLNLSYLKRGFWRAKFKIIFLRDVVITVIT